ncbi:MAG: F0F1 ATP synthase subunit B' [Rhodospirillaceae bacterium]|nr:F0F1 ATP synthase subunit B' [Rhodospirillaceae bacterium]
MPQFDPTLFAGLVFWLAITFTALFFLLSRLVLPRMQDTLEARASRIADDLDRAETLRQEAETVRQQYEEALQEARDQARAGITHAVSEMERQGAEREAALNAEIDARITAAEQRIARARDEARTHIRDIAIEACEAASERISGVKVKKAVVTAAVEGEMKRRNLQEVA